MAYEPRGDRDFHGGHGGGGQFEGSFRTRSRRPVTDYGTSLVQWTLNRGPRYKGTQHMETERPSVSYVVDMTLPAARLNNPADTIPARHLHSSLNKIKHPVNVVLWTPEGRRLLTGSSSGEFTLWNGVAFNFETIMQAHDTAVRAASWSHNDDWLVSADQEGIVKYWQPNFNNVKAIQAHNDAIRDLAFAPTDSKFVTACDDASLKIFDFAGGIEESTLTGHNWDVKSVDWHPTKGLLVSGSKDHQVKLWDPRTGRCLTTLHGHKNTISKTVFEPNRGQLLATCARDQTARVFDLRMMRDVCLLRGHEKDISTLTWHPIHVSLLTTGGSDGSIYHYLLDEPNAPPGNAVSVSPYDTSDPANAPAQTIYPAHKVQYAHDFAVWSLAWHPLGHILASGSNDRVTRFWSRPRPGETECFNDRYHLGEAAAEAQGTWDRRGGRKQMREEEEREMEDEADGLVDQKMPAKQPNLPGIPGLPGLSVSNTFNDGTSIGGAQNHIPGMGTIGIPNPPNGLPGLGAFQGMDPTRLAAMLSSGQLQSPIQAPVSGFMPPGIGVQNTYPMMPAAPLQGAQFQIPSFNPTPVTNEGGIPGIGGEGGAGVRRRAPLPSQHESLMQEQKRGNYRTIR
ncbi:MAG: pre-mRNA cleavage and polyadenylation factor (CPF) complex subunit [Cirrosporium novae-zelandiae]|nr:MAG: pre-mRNA cleavage and polyadenylation factor (CPF) complex subunit [Cirrosporium novae-zelandiae]